MRRNIPEWFSDRTREIAIMGRGGCRSTQTRQRIFADRLITPVSEILFKPSAIAEIVGASPINDGLQNLGVARLAIPEVVRFNARRKGRCHGVGELEPSSCRMIQSLHATDIHHGPVYAYGRITLESDQIA